MPTLFRPTRDTLLALAVLLIASSLSPFALAEAGAFPPQVFFAWLMPIVVLSVVFAPTPSINPWLTLVVLLQVTVVGLVLVVEGGVGMGAYLKTMGTLLGVLMVSAMISSGVMDLRVFVRVAVLCTAVVLALAAGSLILAYFGLLTPQLRFYRGGGADPVYLVGYTLTNQVYPAGAGWFIRPGGVFIEPGQLAMHASLAMLANAVVLDNRRYEWLLIGLGLFTTSLAFYLFLLAFFLLFRRWLALTLYLGGFAVAVLLVGGAAVIQEDVVLTHVLGRVMSFFSTTPGGNRAAATSEVASRLGELRLLGPVKTDAFLGLDADATIWGPFISYGLFGGMFAYLHLLIFALIPCLDWLRRLPARANPTHMTAIFLLLAINVFQRPFTWHFLYYVYVAVMFEHQWRRYVAAETTPAVAVAPTC